MVSQYIAIQFSLLDLRNDLIRSILSFYECLCPLPMGRQRNKWIFGVFGNFRHQDVTKNVWYCKSLIKTERYWKSILLPRRPNLKLSSLLCWYRWFSNSGPNFSWPFPICYWFLLRKIEPKIWNEKTNLNFENNQKILTQSSSPLAL